VSQLRDLLVHEDDDLLVVSKPPGLNTHAPALYAGEGLYEWLRDREPRWAGLTVVHRLDKETSGVMVFPKTTAAARSLTDQFTTRTVKKAYVFVTDRRVPDEEALVESVVARAPAATRFIRLSEAHGLTTLRAEPLTGRTHQIRVQAAQKGFPVLGDAVYGGTPAPRLCLHAEEIGFRHPATDEAMTFRVPADFRTDPRLALRRAVIDAEETDTYRLIHGASDSAPGLYLDRFGRYLLAQAEETLDDGASMVVDAFAGAVGALGAYQKVLRRDPAGLAGEDASPRPVLGGRTSGEFPVRENGLSFLISFDEGYSVGLFLDQRDNRRRLLTGHVAAGFPLWEAGRAAARGREVLNAFAYTCGFSVCAAAAGARVTSLDLSRKYLEWGRGSFAANGLDPADHDFIYGDVFAWAGRLARKGRLYDLVILDPPTFSRAKGRGTFQAAKDYGRLVASIMPLLKPDGCLLASTNAAKLAPERFIEAVTGAVREAGRTVTRSHFAPQPPDFPVSRAEPAYLKTIWLRLKG
jgi:23S rRNA (cytosine1962-C5)-methyltransferase